MKQSFYGKIYAGGYDLGSDDSPIHQQIANFYLELWERFGKPEPVLEPMCGTGSNLIPFLSNGSTCDGLDASPFMLEVFRKKKDQLGLASDLYEQNLEEMELPRQYGFIFIPGGSYGHIYDKQVAAQCLQRLHAHLKPGGWFVFDIRPLEYMTEFGQDGLVDFDHSEYPDGSTVFTTGCWLHLEDGRVIRKWNKLERFVNDQLVGTEIFDYRERLYDRAELEAELRRAGFDEIQVLKAYEINGQPEGKDGIVFSCQKT